MFTLDTFSSSSSSSSSSNDIVWMQVQRPIVIQIIIYEYKIN